MIIFLLFSFMSAFACNIENELTIDKILKRNNVLSSEFLFEKYTQVLLTKSPLRQKYCGERLNSPACLQKLRELDIPTLLKIQNAIGNGDLIIHENSGKADVDEFLVTEFSNQDGRESFQIKDLERMPLILEKMKWQDNLLEMFAVECQQFMKVQQNQLYLSQYKLNASEKLIHSMKYKPIPVYDFFKSPFEETAMHFGDAKLTAEYFSLCMENVEKACPKEKADTKVCDLKRTVMATAIYYSNYFHQLAYFEMKRIDGNRYYSSSGDKLMTKLILQTPELVRDFNRCSSAR